MSTFHAEAMSTANDFQFAWSATYDDVAKTLVLNVTQIDLLTSQPSDAVGSGGVTVDLTNGQQRTFNFFQLGLVNAGQVTQTNINLKSFAAPKGGGGLSYNAWYTPPPRQ